MRSAFMTLLLCATLAGLCVAQPVLAADYPNRPIKLLTMVKPGAQIDLLTRKLADLMGAELGQPVLVVNRAGGSHGSVMAMELKNSKPDGYTLGVGATAAYTYTPHYLRTGYKFEDFEFISLLGLNQSGLLCRADRGWNRLKDVFAWAKKENNGGLTYMFQGSDDRDIMRRIAAKEGITLALMPSQGGPSIISALLGGHAHLGHLGAILFGYVPEKLTLLAASTPTRLLDPQHRREIEDVPTLKEQGWDEADEMYVVLDAPKGLPAEVLDKLNNLMVKLSKDRAYREFVTITLKMKWVDYGRDAAQKYMKSAYERFGRQAKATK